MQHRELSSVLRDDLDRLDGAVGGKEAQEGETIYTLMANSHCYMIETDTPL